jgi:hypothetical protein
VKRLKKAESLLWQGKIEETIALISPLKNGLFVTWYGSIGRHKSTKSLSGKRLN